MSCEKFEAFMDDYLDLSLEQSDRDALEEHLRQCRDCDQQFRFLQSLLTRSASLPRNLMPRRDLWPAISIGVGSAGHLEDLSAAPSSADEKGSHWLNSVIGWRVAAAVFLGVVVLMAAMILNTRAPVSEPSKAALESKPGRVAQEMQSNEPDKTIQVIPAKPRQSESSLPRETGSEPRVLGPRIKGADASAAWRRESTSGNPAGAPSGIMQSPGQRGAGVIEALPRFSGYQDISIGNSPVAIGGDAVYMLRRAPMGAVQPSKQVVVARWKAGQLTSAALLDSNNSDTYAWLGIGTSPDGDLYLAYSHRTGGSYKCAIMKVDFEQRTGSVVWTSNLLRPNNVAISPDGHLYILGMTILDGRTLFSSRSGLTLNLLHIIDSAGNETDSLLPTPITSTAEYTAVLGKMSNARFSVRSNGNFVLTFDESNTALAPAIADYRALVMQDIKEYSPQGSVAETYTFADLPENVFVGPAVFDPEENLIVQATGQVRPSSGRIGAWSGSYLMKISKNPGEQVRRFDLSSPEGLIGVLSDYTLVTRVPARGSEQWQLRFRSPSQIAWH